MHREFELLLLVSHSQHEDTRNLNEGFGGERFLKRIPGYHSIWMEDFYHRDWKEADVWAEWSIHLLSIRIIGLVPVPITAVTGHEAG